MLKDTSFDVYRGQETGKVTTRQTGDRRPGIAASPGSSTAHSPKTVRADANGGFVEYRVGRRLRLAVQVEDGAGFLVPGFDDRVAPEVVRTR
jgi:hypothetical protein